MRKRILLVLLLAVLCTSSVLFAAEGGRYIVRFKPVPVPLKIQNPSHSDVVAHLQNVLKDNMAKIGKIDVSTRDVKNITPLWIANAFAFNGTEKQAAELRKSPNVAEVFRSEYQIFVGKDIDKREVREDLAVIQWGVKRVNAPDVWQEFKVDGAGVVVGVIDTGVYAEHPALKDKVIAFRDFTQDGYLKPTDTQGHGSHVCGSIAGSKGVGVAPGARLIVARVFDNKGGTTTDTLLNAMQWMMDPDGIPETNDAPRLINNSWGSSSSTNTTFWISVENWVKAGILPVFAAGNDGYWGGKVGTPAAFPHSWAVAATASNDTLAAFSSTGPVSWNGKELMKPDIAAPGKDIVSCGIKGDTLVSNSGTSMACPHAAGVAALMYQADPTLTIAQVRLLAEETALDLGDKGKDPKFGSGLIDSYKIVKKVLKKARLVDSYRQYEAAVKLEKALAGTQNDSPLAAPLAKYITFKTAELTDSEFEALSISVEKECSKAAKKLLRDGRNLRKARELHGDK